MVIPHQRLATDTLESLLESYICREGTDYGDRELSLKAKVERLKQQVIANEVVILFDAKSESINILPAKELQKHPETDESSATVVSRSIRTGR